MRIMQYAWMALLVVALLPMTATADLIDAGRTTVDTTTGLEWLDLTETNGLSYYDVSNQLSSGGAFDGWRYASLEEAQTLFTNLGLPLAFQFGYVGAAPQNFTASLDIFARLFGDTVGELHSSYFGALGLIAEGSFSNSHRQMGAYTYFYGIKYNLQTSPAFCCNVSDNAANIYRGSYLVRAAPVPEPATLALFGLGLAGICFAKRKNV